MQNALQESYVKKYNRLVRRYEKAEKYKKLHLPREWKNNKPLKQDKYKMHRSFTKKLFSVHFCLEKFFC